jgi:hypothetical protein
MTLSRLASYVSLLFGALLAMVSAPLACFACVDADYPSPDRIIVTWIGFALGCLFAWLGWARIRRDTSSNRH